MGSDPVDIGHQQCFIDEKGMKKKASSNLPSEKHSEPDTPTLDPLSLTHSLSQFSGKWKIQILCYLLSGTKRFNELRRLLGDIGRGMLSFELKALEADGIVERKQFETIPPTVEYSLTDRGVALKPVLLALDQWAIRERLGAEPDSVAARVEAQRH